MCVKYVTDIWNEIYSWCHPAPIIPYSGNGILYNWYAVNTGILAPAGWHIPTYTEFNTLLTYLDPATAGGISLIAGGYLKEIGLSHWQAPNTGADNSSGFTCLGVGIRAVGFILSMTASYLWSSSVNPPNEGWVLGCSHNSAEANIGGTFKWHGCSIRLIKDDAIDPGLMADYDCNIYPTVKIGS